MLLFVPVFVFSRKDLMTDFDYLLPLRSSGFDYPGGRKPPVVGLAMDDDDGRAALLDVLDALCTPGRLVVSAVTSPRGFNMTKLSNLADPNSCWNKAADDEELFVLRAKDPATPETIRVWAAERIRLGKNRTGDPQMIEALACAARIEKAQIGG